jgi:transketolase
MNLTPLLDRLDGDEKHDWSALWTLDVLWGLYDRGRQDGDRFMLSKGHGPQAYYAVLAAKGVIPEGWLDSWGDYDSPLGHHPDRILLPAGGISSGSLGHGLPIAVGTALTGYRTFVLVGDGELDEGSNWEAVQFAGRRRLTTLTAIVVDNASASYGWPDGIARRFDLEGWDAVTVDGRDHDALAEAMSRNHDAGPVAVIAEVRR